MDLERTVAVTTFKLEGTHRVRTHALLAVALTLTLTCDLETPKTMSFLGYPKFIPYTKFEHFGIIRFSVMLRTNRHTNGLEHPTHTDRLCLRG